MSPHLDDIQSALRALGSSDPDDREQALRDLAHAKTEVAKCPNQTDVIDAIAALDQDPALNVRGLIPWALESLEARTDRTLIALKRLLCDPDEHIRYGAATTLRALPRRTPEITNCLLALASREDEHARFEASAALAAHPDSCAAAISTLQARLDAAADNDEAAAAALSTMSLMQQPIEGLAARLPSLMQRGVAVRAEVLGLIGVTRLRECAALVHSALQDPDEDTQTNAIWALGRLGVASSDDLDVLLQILQKEPPRPLAQTIFEAFSELGPVAARVLPSLARYLESGDWYLRASVSKAIARIGGQDALNLLTPWIHERPDEEATFGHDVAYRDFRNLTLRAVGAYLGALARPLLPEIMAFVQVEWRRYAAAEAAIAIDPSQKEALSAQGWPWDDDDDDEDEDEDDEDLDDTPIVTQARDLTPEETASLHAVTATARAHLKLPSDAPTQEVIAAIGRLIDLTRHNAKTLTDSDLLLGIGGLWGEQLVREVGWSWRHLTWSSGFATFAVVSPDEACATTPLNTLPDHLNGKTHSNTSILLFNMIVAGRLPDAPPRAFSLLR